ncbi:MAG TPA: serine protease, partial [Longimicrobiales bacterium]
EALQASNAEVEALRGEVARAAAARDATGTASLRARLAAAAGKLRRQQTAAGLDFAGIERADRHAVALVYVEYADGRVLSATAFAVRPDGTLVTNRHVVIGDDGARPRRIAIQFSDSEQVWPARVLALADGDDLAILAVERVLGAIPVVRGLNLRPDTLAAGAPVALIGFPNGGDVPRHLPDGKTIVRPLLGAGVLRRVSAERLELEGYGAQGASGTPILDAGGAVLGVLFGGLHADGTRAQVIYAVPASALERLLASVHR